MHCINVILIKKSELRDSKLQAILTDSKTESIESKEICPGLFAFPSLHIYEVGEKIGEGISFAYVETEYFGGGGDQAAALYTSKINGVETVEESREYHAINKILKMYGIEKQGSDDEFDTINLGRYRTNQDFLENEISN